MTTIQHFIDGAGVAPAGQPASAVYNPATGEVSAEVAPATAAELARAIEAGQTAFAAWSQASLAKRTQVLFRFRQLLAAATEELAATISREQGKVLSDARGEVARGLEVVEFACGVPELMKGDFSNQVATGLDVINWREPLGVVVGITPFNFPVMVPLWMAPIAIATGNAFILKPSPLDPSASLILARLWSEAGLPPGVFQVLQGGPKTVNALATNPTVRAVSFVGSTPVAKHIHATATASGKRVQALGGAKNHALVLRDANAAFAASSVVSAAFGAAGQRCMALAVALVEDAIADDFVERVADAARQVTVTHGADAAADMGPVISAAARDRVEAIVTEAAQAGAQVALDGRGFRPVGLEGGFFTGPTVLDFVTPDMRVYREEVFGPVLAIVRVGGLAEAIDLINANPYGNGAAIYTASGAAAREFKRGVNVGMIGVNVPIPVPVAYHSFGGWKDSLIGDFHVYGREGIAFYTQAKVATERWLDPDESPAASFNFAGGSR
ncbi:MAG: CoA-acylating methylmalonate-semialdehyde dehydrogenase [Bifidobacteriaceae bacterium]|nr:CoA-acylating methylmalonate-semialdehyde dehydrogenase [Bifidobacteriaceae bacterium]